MRRQMSPHAPDHAMIATINITPLIDVMLVLLVMLIITIPVARHKVSIDLPEPGPVQPYEEAHRLAIDRTGRLNWDGDAITDDRLPSILAGAIAERPDPTLVMQTDPDAAYDRFHAVLTMVRHAGIRRLGFAGNRPIDF